MFSSSNRSSSSSLMTFMPWLNKSISLASLNEHIFVVYITGLQFLFSRAFYARVHREKKKKSFIKVPQYSFQHLYLDGSL